MSFQISLPPHKRAAARFVGDVSRSLQGVLAEEEAESNLKQAAIARTLEVDRATITRQIHGQQNMTLARVAELAWAMGRKAVITFPKRTVPAGANSQATNDFKVEVHLPETTGATAVIEVKTEDNQGASKAAKAA
jgi:hypothetical protein